MLPLQALFAIFLVFMTALPTNWCGKKGMSNQDKTEAALKDRRVPEGKWVVNMCGWRSQQMELSIEFDCAHVQCLVLKGYFGIWQKAEDC